MMATVALAETSINLIIELCYECYVLIELLTWVLTNTTGMTLLEAQYVRFMLIYSEDLGNETFAILIQRYFEENYEIKYKPKLILITDN